MFFNSNPFDSNAEQVESKLNNESLKNKLVQKYTPRPYHIRTNSTKNTAVGLSYVSNLISFTTGSVALTLILKSIFAQFLPTTPAMILSTSLSCLILATAEGTKREITSNFYKSLLQYKQFKKTGAIAKIAIIFCSALISTIGADRTPDLSAEPINIAASLISTDSISNAFKSKISNAESIATGYFESNKKPNRYGGFRLSSTLMKTYNSLLKDVAKYKDAELAQMQSAIAENKTRTMKAEQMTARLNSEQDTQNGTLAIYLVALVLVFELLFEVCIFYIHYWEVKALKFFVNGAEPATTGPAQSGALTGPAMTGSERKKEANEANEDTPRQAPFINIEGYKDPIFTEQRISQFIDSYKAKLNDWEQRKAKGRTASQKSKDTITSNLEKWNGYKAELKNIESGIII